MLLSALVGILIGGYVFVELIPSRLWTSAQVYRLVFLIKWLGLILLGATAARWILSAVTERWTSGVLLLCGTGELQPVLACLALGAARVGRTLRARLSRVGAHLVWAVLLLVGILVIKSFAAGHELRTMSCFAIAAAWFLVIRRRWLRVGVPVAAVILLLVAVLLNRAFPCPVLSGSQLPIVAELFNPERLVLTVADGKDPGDGVGIYARDHLPENVVCLTPPDFGRFRIVARRALVVDLKSVTFHEAGVREWYQRCVDCYGEPQGVGFAACRRWVADYHAITPQRVRMVAEKYGATHAVLFSETATPLPILYDDGAYKLVEIPAGVEDRATSAGVGRASRPSAVLDASSPASPVD